MIDVANIVPVFGYRIDYYATLAHDLSRLYYGSPVYLVGGALRNPKEDPRDVDLVCVLDDAIFRRFYGKFDDWRIGRAWPNETWLRWARDCAKVSESTSHDSGWRIDFRTQHEQIAMQYREDMRLRLSVEIIPGR